MKVLMLAQFYAPIVGGEERMVETLATALAGRGHEVTVATLRQPGQAAYEERDGIAVHRLSGMAQRLPWLFSEPDRRHASPFPDPETTHALRRVLDDVGPDVVHAHNWLDSAYLPLARRSGAAFVLSLHDYSLVCANKRLMRGETVCEGPALRRCAGCTSRQYGALKGPVVGLTAAAGSRVRRRRADLLLPVSDYVADRCGLRDGPTPFEVIPNFLADPGAENTPGVTAAPLPDEPCIMFAGDLTADKGVLVLLAAHAGMRTPMPLVLVGRPIDPALLSPPENVTVVGPLAHDEVLRAWPQCAIAVAPSIVPETFGLAALEAMRASRPVVAARSGGLQEVVVDGESGLLVPPADVAALRSALDRLAGDEALRRRLGDGARIRAEQFTTDAILPRFERAYERAIQHRRTCSGAA